MKKIFLKRFWIVLISVPAIAGGIALACAGGDDIEYGSSSFTPEAFVDSNYSPFFYSYMFYYGIGHDINHDKRFNETNVSDWLGYFENKVPAHELEYLLVHESAEAVDSAAAYMAGKIKLLPASLKKFTLFAGKSKKVEDFIGYLSLAKKCELFSVNNFESAWEYQEKKKPANVNVAKLNNDLLQGSSKAKDAFLKQRYWFQLVRSYFFNSSLQSAIDLFENNKNNFPKNKLYYRTWAYAAGAYYKQKNYSKANYYYSRVYDGCNELKTVAHYSFHPQEEEDWKATLALCQNKDEQITLWQMLGVFYSDEKRAISEIYKLDPKSKKLDLLLVRAINKEEQKFSAWQEGYRYGTQHFSFNSSGEPVQPELVSLVNNIATSPNTSKPYMWNMAAGYLNMLNREFKKAETQFEQAGKTVPKQKLPQLQLRLLKLIHKIGAANRIDAKLENELLSEIKWLAKFNEPILSFRYTDAYRWVLLSMANKYRAQNELVKAECFSISSFFYANNRNVEAMKAFLDKSGKSAYEELLADLYEFEKSDLLQYQAIRLTFDEKLNEAIIKMEDGWPNTQLRGNPFNGRIQDCNDCDHAASQKVKYTRMSLLRKMKEMQDKIAANDDVYNNALLLANAYYNLTHYGNARYFYEGKLIGEGHYSPFVIDSVFVGFLTDMTLAKKYYTKALQAAKTDEQQAKCHYMLAKCERNQWYNATVYNDKENKYSSDLSEMAFKAWDGFKTLKQQYAHTQYYKDVIKECGYFRTYVGQSR